MERFASFAFGLDLELTLATDGGRETPILADSRQGSDYVYRPNWGLPEMVPPEQTGAPVFRFSADVVHPGDQVSAVIVVPYPMTVDDWNLQVEVGHNLPMYEGSRVCSFGTVVCKGPTTIPLNDSERARFMTWLDKRR